MSRRLDLRCAANIRERSVPKNLGDAVIIIRAERPQDASRVRGINQLAFGQPLEAILVQKLRAACPEALSLVATDGESGWATSSSRP